MEEEVVDFAWKGEWLVEKLQRGNSEVLSLLANTFSFELKQDHLPKKLKLLLFKMCWVKMFSNLKYNPEERMKL